MNEYVNLNPRCRVANYVESVNPLFAGNPLIEALPRAMDDTDLLRAIRFCPKISDEHRSLPTHERLPMLLQLSSFLAPMDAHLELCRLLDSFMRMGYVGRAPRTGAQARIAQELYERHQRGESYQRTQITNPPQLSAALLGTPGMGKTTLFNAYFEHIPECIYHPGLNLYQIPVVRVEVPSSSKSLAALGTAMLRVIDEILPEQGYFSQYALKRQPNAETLIGHAGRLMNIHCTGLVVIDEIQHLNKAGTELEVEKIVARLVNTCNVLRVPIVLVGTHKAARILTAEARQARRSAGYALQHWHRLRERVPAEQVNEWREFMQILWRLQWTRTPVPLDEHLLSLMYYYCQGIISIAITLFAGAQARAMLTGDERITPEILESVYSRELVLIHPLMEKLRTGACERMLNLEDLSSIDLQTVVQSFEAESRARNSRLARVTSLDDEFTDEVESVLQHAGVEPDDAAAAAKHAAASRTPKTLATGIKDAITYLTPPKTTGTKSRSSKTTATADVLEGRPDDYRNALRVAADTKRPAFDIFVELGMSAPLEELVDLS